MMPNGSLVTGFQRRILPNGKISPEIIFWERNGLRHGEFVMPKAEKDEETRVQGLSYNIDSSLLAVHCVLDGQEQLLIYTRSNWKWYCKQIVFIQENTLGLATFVWTKKYQLLFAFRSGKVEFLEF
jgi:elongator complex protein 1